MLDDSSAVMNGSPPAAARQPLPGTSYVFMFKTQKDMGRLATQTMRQAWRFFDSGKQQTMAAIMPAQPAAELGILQSRSVLKEAINRSNETLASAKTVFPIKFFTDEIVLDRTKLTVTKRYFFFSSDTMSIRIEDILNVTCSVGPFFGAVTIATRVLSSDDHFTMNKFWRRDAIHLKHMIQGLVIARHNGIECDHLDHDELVRTLTELGNDTNRDKFAD